VTPDLTPALSKYIVHPLNPLPNDANPLAGDVFFQALNTLPRPEVDTTEDMGRLRGLKEDDLGRLLNGLKSRMSREGEQTRKILEEVERVSGEMDWELRIDDEGEGEAEAELEEVKVAKQEKDDEDEDLFGDDEDDDVVMIDPPVKAEAGEVREKEKEKLPNPRDSWPVVDYVQLMETGRQPPHAAT
jgi:hypothetical protein